MGDIMDKISKGREYRRINLEPSAEANSYRVKGYANTFSQAYTLWDDERMRIDEMVDPHAFDECDMTDVIFQYDHEGRVFARTSNDTLTLTPDQHGLHIEAYLGGT